jgi:hypothetical protein
MLPAEYLSPAKERAKAEIGKARERAEGVRRKRKRQRISNKSGRRREGGSRMDVFNDIFVWTFYQL